MAQNNNVYANLIIFSHKTTINNNLKILNKNSPLYALTVQRHNDDSIWLWKIQNESHNFAQFDKLPWLLYNWYFSQAFDFCHFRDPCGSAKITSFK